MVPLHIYWCFKKRFVSMPPTRQPMQVDARKGHTGGHGFVGARVSGSPAHV